MRVSSFWITIGVGSAIAGASAAQASVADLMKHHVNPAALAFWAAGNDPPEGETPADADARWDAALKAVETLKAEGVRMQAPPYAVSAEWSAFARLMAETAASAEPAIRARDTEGAFEAGGRLYDSCNGCHKAYAPNRG